MIYIILTVNVLRLSSTHLAADPAQEKRDSGTTVWSRFPSLDYDLPRYHTYRIDSQIRKWAAVIKIIFTTMEIIVKSHS